MKYRKFCSCLSEGDLVRSSQSAPDHPNPLLMIIIYLYEDPLDWSWSLPQWLCDGLLIGNGGVFKYINQFSTQGIKRGRSMTTYSFLREIEVSMPNPKKDKKNAYGSNGSSSGSKTIGSGFKWVNIELDDSSVLELEQSEATLEYLSACLCGLADNGLGFKVAPSSDGKSICATLYKSDTGSGGISYGLSAFAGNVRDAELALLYKYEVSLEGSFDNIDRYVSDTTSRSRFR